MELYSEYVELVIQYGFVILFITVVPFSPLFALINNLFEIKLDASKFLKHKQRIVSQTVVSIGVWQDFIEKISLFAIVTNSLVIAFASNNIARLFYDREHNKVQEETKSSVLRFNGFVDYSVNTKLNV